MSSRRKCRELVLKTLYSSEIREIDWEESLAQVLEQQQINAKDNFFIRSLIKQVLEHEEKIDELIKEKLEHWDFKRLNSVDRMILRMGVCEMSVKVSSRRGSITVKAVVSKRPARGVVFMPFHYSEAGANVLTSSTSLDPIAKIPS